MLRKNATVPCLKERLSEKEVPLSPGIWGDSWGLLCNHTSFNETSVFNRLLGTVKDAVSTLLSHLFPGHQLGSFTEDANIELSVHTCKGNWPTKSCPSIPSLLSDGLGVYAPHSSRTYLTFPKTISNFQTRHCCFSGFLSTCPVPFLAAYGRKVEG